MTDQKAAGEVTVATCQRVYRFENHTNYLCGLPAGHTEPCGTEFDKRAPDWRDARIAELEAELAELKSQANEYGAAPRVNLAELADDWALFVRKVAGNCTLTELRAFARIEAALGLKG